ncbi:hypothetical protein TTRE_0000970501 [Trichuris trichiura]|uniref:Uncharacterized protein n=1 Tax=Trichuris trichiura TaxID=36087 RepID=A0A077ZLQ6_TRITR|nr:hypothetical protein TTRE_0000970501 [Trichuris trichiura]
MIKGQRRKAQYKDLVSTLKSASLTTDRALMNTSDGSVLPGRSAALYHGYVLPENVHVLQENTHVLPGESAVMSANVLSVDSMVLPVQSATVLSAKPAVDTGAIEGQQPSGATSDTRLPEELAAVLTEASCYEAAAGSLFQDLAVLAGQALQGQNVLDETAEVVLKHILPPPRSRHRPASSSASPPTPCTARRQKQWRYRQLKRLYNTNRTRLAEVVLDGAPPMEHAVPLADCAAFYTKAFGERSPADSAPCRPKLTPQGERSATNTLVLPILPGELKAALGKISRKSAAGPDRVTVDHVRGLEEAEVSSCF